MKALKKENDELKRRFQNQSSVFQNLKDKMADIDKKLQRRLIDNESNRPDRPPKGWRVGLRDNNNREQ